MLLHEQWKDVARQECLAWLLHERCRRRLDGCPSSSSQQLLLGGIEKGFEGGVCFVKWQMVQRDL